MAEPAPVALNNVFRIGIFQTLNAQRILTVLHARLDVLPAVTTYTTNMQDLASAVALMIKNQAGSFGGWRDIVSDDLRFNYVRAQRIFPSRDIYMQAAINENGNDAEDAIAPNLAVSIEKRTTTPGQMGVGRVQMAGIPRDNVSGGFILGPYLTDVDDHWKTALLTSLEGTAGSVYTIGLFSNLQSPVFSPILDAIAQDTVRTMHRRTVRLGE